MHCSLQVSVERKDREVIQKLLSPNSASGQLRSPSVFLLLEMNLSGSALHLP